MNLKRKVLYVAEYLSPPYDEGIRKTTYNLYVNLANKYEVHAICRSGFKNNNISIVSTNALFFPLKIYLIIKKFKPDVIIYFPFASGTFASYLRLRMLQFMMHKNKMIFINLQDKPLSKWQKLIN